jgi:hypothetical protein
MAISGEQYLIDSVARPSLSLVLLEEQLPAIVACCLPVLSARRIMSPIFPSVLNTRLVSFFEQLQLLGPLQMTKFDLGQAATPDYQDEASSEQVLPRRCYLTPSYQNNLAKLLQSNGNDSISAISAQDFHTLWIFDFLARARESRRLCSEYDSGARKTHPPCREWYRDSQSWITSTQIREIRI